MFPGPIIVPQHRPTSYSHNMPHTQPTAASSSSINFQIIFNNALKAYKRRTKNDLLMHPLAPQLQACETPSAVIAVLQQQVQGLDQSGGSDSRLTKWLNPTVNVLYVFSAALGEGVSLVRLRTWCCLRVDPHICFAGVITRKSRLRWSRDSPLSVYFS